MATIKTSSTSFLTVTLKGTLTASDINKHHGELFTKVVRNNGEIIGGVTG